MSIRIVDNQRETLASVLSTILPEAGEAQFAIAFVKTTGLRLIEKALKKSLERGGKMEFIVGLDFHLTDGEALQFLASMKGNGVSLFCYGEPARAVPRTFHPKLYLLSRGEKVTALVGSSNLTEGGLEKNIEVNVLIDDWTREELISDLYGVYNSFKFQPDRIQPDEDYIRLYRRAASRVRRQQEAAVQDRTTKKLLKELKDKARKLPRPTVSATDLKGWQKLVFDRLPRGRFRTSDMYRYEKEFVQHYPDNRFVADKVRQILQQLRNIGLVRHHGRDLWESLQG